jgi:hypothetical protein
VNTADFAASLWKMLLQTFGPSKHDQYIFSQDTVTGFLLAGIGEVDIKRNSNFLVVNPSEHCMPSKLIDHSQFLAIASTLAEIWPQNSIF